MSIILYSLGLSLLIQIVMFVPAFIFKTDKLTDLSYGLTFIILALIIFLAYPFSFLKLLVLIMILIWGARLSGYLFIRIRKIERDKRFDGIRERFFKFLGFWLLQGISVWVIVLPALLFFSVRTKSGITTLIGFIIWTAGILFEGFADHQKWIFKKNPKNKGKWIQSGLWKYSRHPNYFGEILCWIGVYLFTFSSFSATYKLVALISPAYITFILLFVTGIPKLEKSADKRWGENKDYQEYKKKTSILIPLPRK